jgi:hypothetical protein
MSKFEPGGDAKAISRIASERYGSIAAFVDHHDKAEQ